MLPFCGYNMGDYFAHWLDIGRSADAAKLPRIYFVNWFRKDESGRFVWPGFGENSRVLKWIIERLSGDAPAAVSPIGRIPAPGALDTDGLDIDEDDLGLLLSVETTTWKPEAALIFEHLRTFGDHLPSPLWDQYSDLLRRARLNRTAAAPAQDGQPRTQPVLGWPCPGTMIRWRHVGGDSPVFVLRDSLTMIRWAACGRR